MNKILLEWFNNLANYEIVEKCVYIFSDFPILFLPIFLLFAWVWFSCKDKNTHKKEDLLFIFYSTLIGISLSVLIQQFVHLERPEEYIQATGKLLLSHIPDASFPSDHATVSLAFLTSLFFANYKKIALIFLPFVIIMNISRVIAGVHWPFDILAGICVGVFSSYITFRYLKKIKLVKTVNMLIIKLMGYIKL